MTSTRKTLLIMALTGALAGGAAVGATSLAGTSEPTAKSAVTKAKTKTKTKTKVRYVTVKRGPKGARGLTGKRGLEGLRGVQGATGPQGPAGPAGPEGPTKVVSFVVSTLGGSVTKPVPGLGDVTVTCNDLRAPREITADVFQGTDSSHDFFANGVVPLPVNGMVQGVIANRAAAEAPATFLVSSSVKTNDPDPSQNYCRVQGQVVFNG